MLFSLLTLRSRYRFHQTRLLVVLLNQIIAFSYENELVKLATYRTRDNPLGLLATNRGISTRVIAFPSAERAGYIQVYLYCPHDYSLLYMSPRHMVYIYMCLQVVDLDQIEPHRTIAPVTIRAHEHELAHITLNLDGSKLASASQHGKIPLVWQWGRGELAAA